MEGDFAFSGNHGVGRLHEEERRLAIRVVAHLAGVLAVVAAHAEHATQGKCGVAINDGERGVVGAGMTNSTMTVTFFTGGQWCPVCAKGWMGSLDGNGEFVDRTTLQLGLARESVLHGTGAS